MEQLGYTPEEEISAPPVTPTEFDPELEKIAVREFTKEVAPQERQELASQIWELRHQHFQQLQELSSQAQNNQERLTELEQQLEATNKEIQDLKLDVDYKEAHAVSRLLNFLTLPRLKEKLAEESVNQQQLQQDIEELRQINEDIHIQQSNRTSLEIAQAQIERFYATESQKYKEYLEDREAATLTNVQEKYNCIIVHGFLPGRVPGENSILNEKADWKEKMDIILALSPAVSASSIRDGDSYANRNFWSPMGVILKEGQVDLAYQSDAATKPRGGKRTNNDLSLPRRISEQIDTAITDRAEFGWNELVVSQPEIGALYASLDASLLNKPETPPDLARTFQSYDELYARAEELLVPFVTQVKGEWRLKLRYNPENGEMEQVDEPIELADISKLSNGITAERKKEREQTILAGNIFNPEKLTSEEIGGVQQRLAGYEQYLQVNAANLAKQGTREVFHADPIPQNLPSSASNKSYWGTSLPYDGKNISVIRRFTMFGVERTYFVEDEWESNQFRGLGVRARNHNQDETQAKPAGVDYAWIGALENDKDYNEVNRQKNENPQAYVEYARQLINEKTEIGRQLIAGEWMGQFDQKIREAWARDYERQVNNIAFVLYGFAEAAQEFDDQETYAQAMEVAQTVVDYQTYQNTIARRLDTNGNLILYKEDILGSPAKEKVVA